MKQKKVLEAGFHCVFLLCGLIAVAFVLFISIYLVLSGIPAIREIGLPEFLFGKTWSAGTNQFGILPFILTSVYGTAGAVLLGAPLGIMTAVYIAKVAPARHGLCRLAEPCTHLLCGEVADAVAVDELQLHGLFQSGRHCPSVRRTKKRQIQSYHSITTVLLTKHR